MTYTVKSGDSLSKIAAQNGMTLQQLLQLNPQFASNPNLIKPGQAVNLAPAQQPTQTTPTPTPTQTNPNQAQMDSIQKQLEDAQRQLANAQGAGFGDGGKYAGQKIPSNVLSGAYDTGNKQLNDMLVQLGQYLDTTVAAGKVVNPAIELTPSQISGFLDQATKEISPYYASQINSIKDDVTKSIGNLQKQYDIQKQTSEANFKSDLANQRENNAGSGLAFSGVRGQQENNLASAQQRTLDLAATQTEGQIGNSLRTTEGQIGSANLPTNLPQFTSSTVSTQGAGGYTPGRTLDFSGATTGNIYGTLPGQQLTDKRKRQNELETAARQSRVLDFYNT